MVFVGNVKAQYEIEASSYVMQSGFGVGSSTIQSLGQSFYHTEGVIHSVRLTVMDMRAMNERPAQLTIYEGLEGESPTGEVVVDTTVTLSGLNKFYSQEVIDGVTNGTQATALWNDVMFSAIAGDHTFDEVQTEFVIDQYLPVGYYTMMISVDHDTPDVYNGGSEHYPQLYCFVNCANAYLCQNDTVINPYSQGQLINGGTGGPAPPDLDMAFEVTIKSIQTEVMDVSTQNLSITIENGLLLVPNDWNGDDVTISNLLGQSIYNGKVQTGQLIQLPKGQVSFVSRLHLGKRQTAKVFVL
jgi:hypothetical protein